MSFNELHKKYYTATCDIIRSPTVRWWRQIHEHSFTRARLVSKTTVQNENFFCMIKFVHLLKYYDYLHFLFRHYTDRV